MADSEAQTPRVILVRHGETEWAKNGRFTGTTEIELTEKGVAQVASAAKSLVGVGKTIDPRRLATVLVSPRRRAVATFKLLWEALPCETDAKPEFTEDLTEWDYGNYEGLTDFEIRLLRKNRGLDRETKWNIYADGCEGGESEQDITARLSKVAENIKRSQMSKEFGREPADVLVVAHGLILRCFVKVWLGKPVSYDLPLTFSPGAIALLGYKTNEEKTPCMYLGIALAPEEVQ